jgi:hypothetical protein
MSRGAPRGLGDCAAPLAFAFALLILDANPASAQRLDGVNVIASPGHPYGSPSAKRSLAAARRLGTRTVAIIPFLWQASPEHAIIGRGKDMSDDELRAAIRDSKALGYTVVVKPHVWVPESWAGAVAARSEEDWRTWFDSYRTSLERIAAIAAEENADVLAIGTELAKTTHRSEWRDLIAAARAVFPHTLIYVAHNVDEAEKVPFWSLLDVIGVSLYPALGADRDRDMRLLTMRGTAERLDALATRWGKMVLVAEVGLRSAEGAAAKPWESAEERTAAADPFLQAEVLADWLTVLQRPAVRGVLVWRWLTDPAAGGPADTDFTVQGKPAEGVLLCARAGVCPSRPLQR